MVRWITWLAVIAVGFCATVFSAVGTAAAMPLDTTDGLRLHDVQARVVEHNGKRGIEVSATPEAAARVAAARRRARAAGETGPPSERFEHLAVVADGFQDGTITVELAGQPATGVTGGARGFVGVAFRVQDDLETFECIYLRPTNGRAPDQERRNHSVQYVSHPDYPWYRLRRETPSRYESYVDLQPGEWTQVKIVVEGASAKLYVRGNEQPTLIVNDLKLGAETKGAVALWIEGSTVAHFRNLTIEE